MIPFITTGNSHDGTSTISGQHIFGCPDRYLPSVKRIDGIGSGEYTGYFFLRHSFPFTPAFYIGQVFINSGCLFFTFNFTDQIQFGGHDHEVHPKNGIGTGSVHPERINRSLFGFYFEINFSPTGFTDPVSLHFFHGITEIHGGQSLQQTVGIGRDPQIPLAHPSFLHRMTTTLTHPIYHFIIGQYSTQCLTPVYFSVSTISQSPFHQPFFFFRHTELLPLVCCKMFAACCFVFGDQFTYWPRFLLCVTEITIV